MEDGYGLIEIKKAYKTHYWDDIVHESYQEFIYEYEKYINGINEGDLKIDIICKKIEKIDIDTLNNELDSIIIEMDRCL